jgi:hypothetical protein
VEEDHMTAKTSLGLTYPLSSDHTRLWEHIQQLAADADALLVLPDEVVASQNVQSFSGTAATFASLPTPVTASIINPRSDKSLLCHVHWGGWLKPDAVEGRLGIFGSGGNTFSAPTGGTNGPQVFSEQQLIVGSQTSGTFIAVFTEFTMRVPAGQTTSLEVQAYRSATTNVVGVNYAKCRITPLRYL